MGRCFISSSFTSPAHLALTSASVTAGQGQTFRLKAEGAFGHGAGRGTRHGTRHGGTRDGTRDGTRYNTPTPAPSC